MHTCTNTCIYAHMQMCMHICMCDAYMHICMHVCIYAHMHACVMHMHICMCDACMHAHIHICRYACTYSYVHAHIYMHIYICAFIHPHTWTYACTWTHAFTWAHNASINVRIESCNKVIIHAIDFQNFLPIPMHSTAMHFIGTMHCCQLADSPMSTYCWKPANGVTRHPWQFTGATTQVIRPIILAHLGLCQLFPALAVVASICHWSPAHAGEWMKDILHLIRL